MHSATKVIISYGRKKVKCFLKKFGILVFSKNSRETFPTMCTITHGEKYVIIITIFEGYGMIQIKKSVTARDGKTKTDRRDDYVS